MLNCTSCGDSHPASTSACPRTGQPVQSGLCGSQIDRYQVERLLGEGGMGAVYRGRHLLLHQPVAIKLLHPEFARRGDMLERFMREARASASIGNEHIIRVHDCGLTQEGRAFIVMELLEGKSLEDLLQDEGRIDPARAVEITAQVLDGLGAAHGAGIIHRDMKPANVFVRPSKEPGRPEFVTVLDFGISKVIEPGSDQKLTQTGAVLGTPLFMAPEQIMSPQSIDHRIDIYATGVMLYQMLSGRLPYEGSNTAELIVKACTTPPVPLRDVARDLPPALVEVVEKAMAREASARWQSTAEFTRSLRAALASPAGYGTSPGLAPSPSPNLATGVAPTAWISQPAPFAPVTPPTAAPPAPYPPAQPLPTFAAPPPPSLVAAPVPVTPSGSGRSVKIAVILVASFALLCVGSIVAAAYFVGDTDDPTADPTSPGMQPIPAPTQPEMRPLTQPAPHPAPQAHAPAPTPAPSPSMTPLPGNSMTPVPPPSGPGAPIGANGVHVGEPNVVGDLSVDHLLTAFEQLETRVQPCRPRGATQHVRVLAIINENGQIPIARPADDNEGDEEVARCVANRFRAMSPIDTGGTDGIVMFPVALAPR
jgi:serine/threonine-protein kinase